MSDIRPNILLILTDQQRFDTLGCNGNNAITTPALDRLASEGANLSHVFVQSPMCTPSRAALATGRYPSINGARWNGTSLPTTERTYMQELSDGGYSTNLFGKLHLRPHTERRHDDPTYGFDKAVIAEHPRGNWASAYSDWIDATYPTLDLTERIRTYDEGLQTWVSALPPEAHLTTWAANETIDFLKAKPQEPFFASMSIYDPHHPFDPPEPYASMYDPADVPAPVSVPGELDDKPSHFLDTHFGRVNPILGHATPPERGGPATPQPDLSQVTQEQWRRVVAHYYGMISLIDDQVARVLDALRATGLEENTIVIFTSDHGELLGDHGLLFKGPHHYDCVIRVPTLIRWPGRIAPNTVVDDLVELIDLSATILDMAGLQSPPGMQGHSILPVLEGQAHTARESVLVERQDAYWNLDLRTIRTADWKLNYYRGLPSGELYDLKHDPSEFTNLWDDPGYASVRSDLTAALLDRVLASADQLPEATAIT